MKEFVRRLLNRTIKYQSIFNDQRSIMNLEMEYKDWVKLGKPQPVPANVKRELLLIYKNIFNISIFIETGTFAGDTTFAMKDHFKKIYTIEIDKKLATKAKIRFKNENNISVISGDSGTKIKNLLMQIPKDNICLFWLDGHFSYGITSKSFTNTPVLRELEHILSHNVNHIILIDDARLFNGTDDYPNLEEISSILNQFHCTSKMEIINDIITILPKGNRFVYNSGEKNEFKKNPKSPETFCRSKRYDFVLVQKNFSMEY